MFTQHSWGSAPPLDDRRVHLWHCDVDALQDPALLQSLAASLDDVERQRCERFRFARDRHRFLVSHGFLRHVLSLYVSRAPSEWRFTTEGNGKPVLSRAQALHAPLFNLSHSDRSALVGVATRGALLGVDIEYQHPGRRIDELASRKFAAIEFSRLQQLAGTARADRFHDLWSLKESYIKACGEGLRLPLDKFAFCHGEEGLRFETDPVLAEQSADWVFWTYCRTTLFSIGVAWRVAGREVDEPLCMDGAPGLGWSEWSPGTCMRSVRNTAI
jgi:4'-phosphopantetheinyl transferase